ncbi:hypothetical protein ACX0G9_04235 [Flavitalea flava]
MADSEDDKQHLAPEKTIIDLPDVEDIPGQENIRIPRWGEMADTTISSADEEGDDIFEGEDEDLEKEDGGKKVTSPEKALLRRAANQTPDDESETDVKNSALDSRDNEGDLLNEGNLETDRFGEDLDLPESESTDDEQ